MEINDSAFLAEGKKPGQFFEHTRDSFNDQYLSPRDLNKRDFVPEGQEIQAKGFHDAVEQSGEFSKLPKEEQKDVQHVAAAKDLEREVMVGDND